LDCCRKKRQIVWSVPVVELESRFGPRERKHQGHHLRLSKAVELSGGSGTEDEEEEEAAEVVAVVEVEEFWNGGVVVMFASMVLVSVMDAETVALGVTVRVRTEGRVVVEMVVFGGRPVGKRGAALRVPQLKGFSEWVGLTKGLEDVDDRLDADEEEDDEDWGGDGGPEMSVGMRVAMVSLSSLATALLCARAARAARTW
jgi:hypothetical protein